MQIRNIFILLALLLLSVSVYAGYAQPAPVEINYDEGYAQGDMISARNSVNEFEFIGCGTRSFDDGVGGVYNWGVCQASLEEEVTVTCFVYDNPALMEGINIISDSS